MQGLRNRRVLGLSAAVGFATLVGDGGAADAALLQSFSGPYETTGGGVGLNVVDTTTDAGDWITANGFNGTGTGTLYYGFDVRVTNNAGDTGAGGLFSALQLFAGASERLGVTNNFSSVNWSYFNGGGNGDLRATPLTGAPNPITPPEAARIVVRVNFNGPTPGDETATVWFNPNPLLPEAAQDTGITTPLTTPFNAAFDSVRARTGNTTAAATYSNVQFATDFTTAAVPEPATAGLLGAIGVGLLARRRARALA